jgi:hypothetical protein
MAVEERNTPALPTQNLNPKDIAGEALTIARECAAAMLFPRTPVLVMWARVLELQEANRRS